MYKETSKQEIYKKNLKSRFLLLKARIKLFFFLHLMPIYLKSCNKYKKIIYL